MKIAIKISLISIISIFIISCSGAKPDISFLKLDSSKGFAGDISKAPDETKAPDRNPNISSENIRPLLKSSMLSDEFTPPLSLRSLDTCLPIIVNLKK